MLVKENDAHPQSKWRDCGLQTFKAAWSPNPVTSVTLGLTWRGWGPTPRACRSDCGRSESRTLHALRRRGLTGARLSRSTQELGLHPCLPPATSWFNGKCWKRTTRPHYERNAVIVCRWAPTKQVSLGRWKTEQPSILLSPRDDQRFPSSIRKDSSHVYWSSLSTLTEVHSKHISQVSTNTEIRTVHFITS